LSSVSAFNTGKHAAPLNVKLNAVSSGVPPPSRAAGRLSCTNGARRFIIFFPDLFDRLRQVEDCRQKSEYSVVEILLAAIMLFVFQQGSRNALNNKRHEKKFKNHYERLFKLRLPHLDTVHHLLCRLPDTELEPLKHTLVKTLLEKRVLHKYRLFERWFVVAVDGTGVVSFRERHCEHCLHRTSKSGKTTYFHPVLEAKLITASGLAISLATEWIANPDGEYDKQDCEVRFVDPKPGLSQVWGMGPESEIRRKSMA
jgi:hypothetical protein